MPLPSQTNPAMSAEGAAVLRILENHKGRDRAIKSAEVGGRIGLSDRRVRMVIKELVEDFNQPILSSPIEPAGFYLAQTRGEYTRAIDSLRGRVKSLCVRIASLSKLQAEANG